MDDLRSRLANRVQLTTDGHKACYVAVDEAFGGDVDLKGDIATSYVERQNLTMRMSMRRFTCLTNAFSKKVENLDHAIALHFMHYNFCRIHQTLRVTPAMESGLTDHVWDSTEIANLTDKLVTANAL